MEEDEAAGLDMNARRSRLSSLRKSDPASEAAVALKKDVQIGDSTYTGQMLPLEIDGKEELIMHGEGVRSWPNGDEYDGQYCNGEAMGNGKFTYANGDVYEG
jgi:hypothetical protein